MEIAGSSPAPHVMIKLSPRQIKELYVLYDNEVIKGMCRISFHTSVCTKYKYAIVYNFHIRKGCNFQHYIQLLFSQIACLCWEKNCVYIKFHTNLDKNQTAWHKWQITQVLTDRLYYVENNENKNPKHDFNLSFMMTENEMVNLMFDENNQCGINITFQGLSRSLFNLSCWPSKKDVKTSLSTVNDAYFKNSDVLKFKIGFCDSFLYYNFEQKKAVIFDIKINQYFSNLAKNVSRKTYNPSQTRIVSL